MAPILSRGHFSEESVTLILLKQLVMTSLRLSRTIQMTHAAIHASYEELAQAV
jgi:hypothetical protein